MFHLSQSFSGNFEDEVREKLSFLVLLCIRGLSGGLAGGNRLEGELLELVKLDCSVTAIAVDLGNCLGGVTGG